MVMPLLKVTPLKPELLPLDFSSVSPSASACRKASSAVFGAGSGCAAAATTAAWPSGERA